MSFNSTYLLFERPSLTKCLEMPIFGEDRLWPSYEYHQLCQDVLDDGIKSPIYDGRIADDYEIFLTWQNNLCCSQSNLISLGACSEGNKCSKIDDILSVINEKYLDDYTSKTGFELPIFQPKRRTFVMVANVQGMADEENPFDLFYEMSSIENESTPKSTSGCCQCQSHRLPEVFHSQVNDSGFLENKHQVIQLVVSALEQVQLIVVAELLHGQYLKEFESKFNDVSTFIEVRVHLPNRAHFVQHRVDTSRETWLTVIDREDFSALDLPLNLPNRWNDEGTKRLENAVLIDRPSDILVGARSLPENTVVEALKASGDNGREETLPYALHDRYGIVKDPSLWWDIIEKSTRDGISFLYLPYFPFFSNCKGYDSHISVSHLTKDHPNCTLIHPDNIVPVYQNDWSQRSNPWSDVCQEDIDRNGLSDDLDSYKGIDIQCMFEEDLDSPAEKLRWFEAPGGITLFHLTKEPQRSDLFEAKYKIQSDGTKLLTQFWGRSSELSQMLRSDNLIPVIVDDVEAGVQNAIPRRIKLELQYFQISPTRKRLVQSILYFDDLCTNVYSRDNTNKDMLNSMTSQGISPCELDIKQKD